MSKARHEPCPGQEQVPSPKQLETERAILKQGNSRLAYRERGLFQFILGDPGAVSRAGRKGATKVFKHGRKSPWVPTLTGPFPNGQANAGSWLGTKNALYYCAQSANSFSWVLFVSSYTTAIISPQLAPWFSCYYFDVAWLTKNNVMRLNITLVQFPLYGLFLQKS